MNLVLKVYLPEVWGLQVKACTLFVILNHYFDMSELNLLELDLS